MSDTGSMLEQVAHAIFESEVDKTMHVAPWEEDHDQVMRRYLKRARAAIAAMRQPTQEMMAAAYAAVGRDPNVMDAWQAMIAAALGET